MIGWVGEHFGARWTLVLGGALVILGAGLASILLLRSNARTPGASSDDVRAPGEDLAAAS